MTTSARWWKPSSLTAKGILVLAFPIVGMLLSAGLGLLLYREAMESRRWVLHALEVQQEGDLALQDISLLWAKHAAFLLSGNQDSEASRGVSAESIKDRLALLGSLVADNPAQTKRVGALEVALGDWLEQLADQKRAATEAGAFPSPLPQREFRETQAQFDAISDILEGLLVEERNLYQVRSEAQRSSRSAAFITLGAGLLIGLVGGILTGLYFVRGIIRRIGKLGAYASNGDTHQFDSDELHRQDELAVLAKRVKDAKELLETRVAERTAELAVTNERLEEEATQRQAANNKLHQQLLRMNLLNQITTSISDRHDLTSVFNTVLGSLRDSLGIDVGVILYFDEHSHLLIVGARVDREPTEAISDLRAGAISQLGENGLKKCVEGATIYVPDLSSTSPEGILASFAAADFRSVVAAPMRASGTSLGIILLACRNADSFNSTDCEFLTQLGEHVAIAITQLRLLGELKGALDDLSETQEHMFQQERLRAMGQMASGIAHDINNALGPMVMYCEMLLEFETALPESSRTKIQSILQSAQGIAKTVAGLRYFYRPDEEAVVFSEVDLHALIRQVAELTRPRWRDIPQQSGIEIQLQLDFASQHPNVACSETDLRNVVTNLVFNAVDAMPSGGMIMIRTRDDAASFIIEVIDTGYGMDERTRQRCLEPFFTTKGKLGSGLGLAMVFGIMKRHGGTVEVDSAPGKGSTFRLVLPRATTPTDSSDGSAVPVAFPARPLSILCVDDDPAIRMSLSSLLEAEGYSVEVASNGSEALEACARVSSEGRLFDVVLSDLGMPGMDGRELASRLHARWPDLPIILLTGWGSYLVDQAEQMKEFAAVISKPARLRDLRQALAKVF